MKQTILHYLSGQEGITETFLAGFYLVLLFLIAAILCYTWYIVIQGFIKLSKRRNAILDQSFFHNPRETSLFGRLSNSTNSEI